MLKLKKIIVSLLFLMPFFSVFAQETAILKKGKGTEKSPIVDKLGERLYKKNATMFIQKHYNAVYPILSMIEDMR